MMNKFFPISILLLFLSSCYYDNIGEMRPEVGLTENCDSTGVTFTKDIKPILEQYFGTGDASCHSSNNTNQNPSLASYVDDSLAVHGDLLASIVQDGSVKPMPNNGGKLSDCKINKFKAWINNNLPQ